MRAARGRAQGQVRQEGHINRIAGALLIAVLAFGCGPGSSHSKAKDKAKAKDDDEQKTINTGGGTATGFAMEGPRQPRWKVNWKSAKLILHSDGNSITEMQTTDGSFMKDGKEASRFTAGSGISNKATGDIDANGQVVVISLAHDATLHCDHINYASKGKEIVKATGHVRVEGKWGDVTGLNELWATPDLKVFGTPDLFQIR